MRFYLSNGSRQYPIRRRGLQIGRDQASDVRVRDSYASRQHCKIFYRSGRLYLQDSSTNGTLVNGVAVATTELNVGDIIRVSSEIFVIDSRRRGVWERLVELSAQIKRQTSNTDGLAGGNRTSVTGSVA